MDQFKNARKIIDFIIIGAARSGTTSLFAYLRAHPQVYIPLEKEVCFFSDNDRYQKGPDWYLKNYFSGINRKEKIVGEATPAYMLFEYVAERIYKTTPSTKLIAILRNPVQRAYSHYRFAKRLNIENRDFYTAINQLVVRGKISDSQIGNQNVEYVMFGEYGRILKKYMQYFRKNRVKIIFFEDFKKDTFGNMAEIYDYLGVDSMFESDEFYKRHNVEGETRFKSILKLQQWLKSNEARRRLLLKIFSTNLLGAMDMWLTRKGNVKEVKSEGPDEQSIALLKNYYKNDVELFEKLFDIRVPWPEFR